MLHELRIENLLLIERAELRFAGGLNAITGETGAGKTILAHSLDLLMGGKARPQIVRPGADEAYVEGVFALPEELLADPELAELRERLPADTDEIVLGRRIAASGRTSAFVQGRSASASDLRALGSRLLAFYGQHEHRRLVLSSAQLEILDGFAGAEQLERRGRYRDAHAEVVALSRELAELARARGSEGAGPRPVPLRAGGDRGGRPRSRRGARAGGRARSPAPRRGPARGGVGARWRRSPAPRTTWAARAACLEGPRRTWRRWTGSTPRSTRSPSESARSRSSSTTRRARCAPTWRESRPSPAASSWSRSACTRSTA